MATKLIVRRLPPDLPEPVFWEAVNSFISDDSVLWRMYCGGKKPSRPGKDVRFSRAYIAFASVPLAVNFASAFDGHIFVKSQTERVYPAQVEIAPYRDVPKTSTIQDNLEGTLETG